MHSHIFAAITAFDKIKYTVTPAMTLLHMDDIRVYADGGEVGILGVTSLGVESESGIITVDGEIDLTKTYEIALAGVGRVTAVPMGVFDSEIFQKRYTYRGDDHGAHTKDGQTTFKVWAPTASSVVLDLYEAGHGVDAYAHVEMTKGTRGVWSHTESCGHGTYYTYTVTTAEGTQTATDPYARASGLNGERSMVVNLSLADPAGWAEDENFSTGIKSYSDAVIWETHVRDFSQRLWASRYRGKFLAFTERGLTNDAGIPVGVDYVKALGVTHVHLLPIFDYATVDEANPGSGYNWGYDPQSYNVPEGSYSTDPEHGEVRILELKAAIAALHRAGIGVIMDVVYNHTYARDNAFARIVPYYYYRHTETGAHTNASGCGNDTASERYMYRKFMVDSVTYWLSEYHLDGFRFDLMGLHDLETMQEIEHAVHRIKKEALIYGEGWTMGATIDGSAMANKDNIAKLKATRGAIGGIAVFNDAIRDGLKGGVFDGGGRGYINGAPAENMERVQYGIRGGDVASINYMSAHDNHTLWDKLALANSENTEDERMAMNRLGAAILMLSRGTPFWQAGEEMLRSKGGNENSYNADADVNALDWNALAPGSDKYEMHKYYKALIEMRKAYPIFRTEKGVELTFSDLGGGRMAVTLDGGKQRAHAVINPNEESFAYTLDAGWDLIATEWEANFTPVPTDGGEITVGACGIRIYVTRARS